MNINNGNMPAMPIADSGHGEYAPEVHFGLTKREMMAMNSDVSEELKSMDNFMDMAYFLGEDFKNQMTLEGKISLKFRVAAKLKAMAADALLKELSK